MDPDKTWHKISEKLKEQLPSGQFQTFFKGAGIQELNEENIVIATPSAFHQASIKTRFLPILDNIVEHLLGKKLLINFIVDSQRLVKNNSQILSEEDLFQPIIQATNQIINPKYTLENFVVGLSNNVAYAGAQAVAQNPGISYNPLFIYGGTGVGKTHLTIGIGNAVLKTKPTTKIIYCSSEQFTNDYISAIQNHRMGDFRAKYRSVQILLIDDVQFFSGREGTQEEFFHTFNELQSKNSQMVITSDRPPNEIAKLEDRLRSRFAGGLMVDIQSPDFDTRVAILKAKSTEWGSILPDDSLKLIASSTNLSIRELEGKLMQIIQNLKTRNLTPTSENITSYLNPTPLKKPSLTHTQIISQICSYFKLSTKDLAGPKRQKELVLPRHIVMYLLSEEFGMTVEKIGQVLGGRDHTTVMHGRNKIRELINKDRGIQKMIIEIKNDLSTI